MRLGTGVTDPTPAVRCNGAAIAPAPASSTGACQRRSLSISLVGMMPDLANPVQHGITIIELDARWVRSP